MSKRPSRTKTHIECCALEAKYRRTSAHNCDHTEIDEGRPKVCLTRELGVARVGVVACGATKPTLESLHSAFCKDKSCDEPRQIVALTLTMYLTALSASRRPCPIGKLASWQTSEERNA